MQPPADTVDDKADLKGDTFPGPEGCLMIFGDPKVQVTKRRVKLIAREVYTATCHPDLSLVVKLADHL